MLAGLIIAKLQYVVQPYNGNSAGTETKCSVNKTFNLLERCTEMSQTLVLCISESVAATADSGNNHMSRSVVLCYGCILVSVEAVVLPNGILWGRAMLSTLIIQILCNICSADSWRIFCPKKGKGKHQSNPPAEE